MQAGVRPLSTEELLLAETRESKTIAFGLRMNAGIDPELLPATTISSLLSAKKDSSKTTPPPRVRLTARGRLLADEIAAQLI
jgi:hypothetical protein